MQGIVTLLDPDHYAQTEALWAEMADALGLRGIYVTPYPHFSYHVAAGYDRARLEAALRQAAARTRPFSVTTTGLGTFTGPAPVLYIPVVRTAELSAFHADLWAALEDLASGSLAYYSPARWVPHITISFGDLTLATLAEAVHRLGERSFNWEILVDNLAYIDETGGEQRLQQRVTMGSAEADPQ